ncbi:MAG: hypothetical protein IJT27_04065 [Clostridia bacterium]|nr:hypothetical protein [Clostridia bacterium]
MADLFNHPSVLRAIDDLLIPGLEKLAAELNDGPGFKDESFDFTRHFYSGNKRFLKNPARGAKWRLGYAVTDLTPYDYDRHTYYLGGYLMGANGYNNQINDLIDKMQCRIIALDDGSGRGVSVFATIDAIGLGNRHIKQIRRKLADLIKYEGPTETLCSVNIFSTHAHSCVDTQGLWTNTGKKAVHNLLKNKTGKGTYLDGPDPDFMRFATDAIARGIQKALRDLTPGSLTYAKKDIGEGYFSNRNRKSATALSTELVRFVFTPDDKSLRPTILASFPAHPDVAGMPTNDGQGTGRELCGEYVYYMGELIGRAGYNFIFINGAICAIYMRRELSNDGVTLHHRYEQSIRFGRELARITLALTKTTAEIEADPLLCDKAQIQADKMESEQNGLPFTLWYENWTPVREKNVPALLNIRLKQVRIPATNPLILLVGKLNLASYDVIALKNGGYAITTEVGYLEIGRDFKAVMVPGEFCQDLLSDGASLHAEGAYHKTEFPYPSLKDAFDCDLYAFGLANDAIGYIVPDNDYILGRFDEHYHELISLGEHTGSAVVKALIDLRSECI